jgi:predicted protein tyrosine phosphatase
MKSMTTRDNDYRSYSSLWYASVRLLKDAWSFFDRRPRLTCVNEQVVVGGTLTARRAALLRQEGIDTVVSLQGERLDDMTHLRAHLWLPSRDGRPPDAHQLELGVRFIRGQVANGRKVYIHCHAGVGRAPTLAAAYLVSTGVAPDDAIAAIRAVRPWIRMNARQRAAVYEIAARSGA